MLRRLEELPIGSFHYKMLLVTGLGWLFDAMDTGLIAFVLPLLVKDWGLSPAQAGWIRGTHRHGARGGRGGFFGRSLGAQEGLHCDGSALQYIDGALRAGLEL